MQNGKQAKNTYVKMVIKGGYNEDFEGFDLCIISM